MRLLLAFLVLVNVIYQQSLSKTKPVRFDEFEPVCEVEAYLCRP